MRLAVVTDPISTEALTTAVDTEARARGRACGAVASFIGIVRGLHQGRVVKWLDYEAFEPLAVKAFQRIEAEISEHWPDATLALHHRIGRLHVGEPSIVIAVATPHRAEAFQACRYAIERVKQIAPIWKHEFLEDGDSWVEGALVPPDDAAARREALARACA